MVIVQSSCKQYNNRYIKGMTPIAMKSILPSGPLQTKLIIINYNNHDKAYLQIVIILKDLKNSSILPS